ncbi:MAG: M1 family aminopeptidase, partial [Chthoniobacterales bacterium]
VLVSPALLSRGLNSEAFQERVTHELAHNWFGDEVFFSRFTAIGLGEGLPEYATIVAEESQKGEPGRRTRVLNYLREYDEAKKNAEEIPLGITARTDAPGQQRIAEAKAALFFVAVEDACGEKQMRDGLKDLISLLRGQEVNYDVLRAQLEHVSGKKLADLFRVWLNDKGIPEDFRARYAS